MSGPTTRSPNLLPRVVAVESRRVDQWAAAGASIDLGSHKIVNLLDPTSAQDAASKAYVDAHAGGTAADVVAPLSNGTADATVINLLMLASAAGSVVRLRAGQTYVLEAALSIPSNITLDLRGAKLSRKTSYIDGGPMIVNAAVTANRTVNDGAITATANVLTSATAAFTSADISRNVSIGGSGSPVAPPVTVGAVAAASGGTIPAATTYYYVVTSLTDPGESLVGIQRSATTGGGGSNSITLTWAVGTFSTGFAIYRSTVSGDFTNAKRFVVAGGAYNFIDTGAAGVTATPPVTDTTGGTIYTTITGVTNGTTVTVAPNAVKTVTGSKVVVFNRDVNVGLRCDVNTLIASGSNLYPPNGQAIQSAALLFRRIDGFVLDGGMALVTHTFGTSFFKVADVTNWVCRDWRFDSQTSSADAIHVDGPCQRFEITNCFGTTSDDFVALCGRDWSGMDDTYGDITDGVVSGMYPNNAMEGVKVIGGTRPEGGTCKTRNLTVEKVYGTVRAIAVIFSDDLGGPLDMMGCVVRDISCTTGTHGYPVNRPVVSVSGSNVHGLRIENINWVSGSGTASNQCVVIDLYGGHADQIKIDQVNVPTGCNYIDAVHCATGFIDRLEIESANMAGCQNSNVLRASSGTITNLQLDRPRFYGTANVNNRVVLVDGIATISRVAVRGYELYNGTAVVDVQNASATVPKISLSGGNGSPNYGVWTNVATTITLSDNDFTGVILAAIRNNGAGMVTVHGDGTNNWGAAGFQNVGPLRVTGVRCPVDASVLTPTYGDEVNNTNAALAAGAGAVVYVADGHGGGSFRPLGKAYLNNGTATLVGGTVTVADTKITSNSQIRLTTVSPGGTVGAPYISSRATGSGFTITSTSGTDTSIVYWEVVDYTPYDPITAPILALGPAIWERPEVLSALANNAQVPTWPDTSPNARDDTQATGGLQPLYKTAQQNGLSAVYFDGVDDVLSRAAFPLGNNAATVFAVARLDAAGTYPTILSYAAGNMELRYNAATRKPEFQQNVSSAQGSPVTLGTWHMFRGTFDGVADTLTLHVDGVLAQSVADTSALTASGTLTMGARSTGVDSMNGAIGERLVFPYAMTAPQAATVESYLKASGRWATP